MQKVAIENIIPGSVVAQDIYNDEGVMLVPKGTVIKDGFSRRLEEIGVDELFVERTERDNKKILEKYQNFRHIDDIIYQKTREQAQKLIKKTMIKLSSMGHINANNISELIDDIIEQLLSKKEVVLTLSRLRSIDNYTYEHSVNVSVTSLMIGIDLGLNKFTLKNLGLGAILHDVGKVGVSEDILKKTSRLTKEQFEAVKSHTEYGYRMLLNSNVSEEAAQIALYHHEKYDGTGYNGRLRGEEIPLLSRIVTIADAYDAMSNDRVYKKKMPPDKVYREIASLGGKHFDLSIAGCFLHRLDLYPVGTGVVLNNRLKGIVIAQNKLLPESPCVRIFSRNESTFKMQYVDIDLAVTDALYISGTF